MHIYKCLKQEFYNKLKENYICNCAKAEFNVFQATEAKKKPLTTWNQTM